MCDQSARHSDPTWLKVAFEEHARRPTEGVGNGGQNSDIIKYLSSVLSSEQINIRGDQTPWCSAFVNWCLNKCGIKGSKSALAYSWKKQWGIPTHNIFVRGDVLVIDEPGPLGSVGHTGFLIHDKSEHSICALAGHINGTIALVNWPKDKIFAHRRPYIEASVV